MEEERAKMKRDKSGQAEQNDEVKRLKELLAKEDDRRSKEQADLRKINDENIAKIVKLQKSLEEEKSRGNATANEKSEIEAQIRKSKERAESLEQERSVEREKNERKEQDLEVKIKAAEAAKRSSDKKASDFDQTVAGLKKKIEVLSRENSPAKVNAVLDEPEQPQIEEDAQKGQEPQYVAIKLESRRQATYNRMRSKAKPRKDTGFEDD